MKRNKRVSTIDFYHFYPHKINPPASNTIPTPYIKEADTTPDAKHAMTYKDWRRIVDVYVEYIREQLLRGKEVKLASSLGKLQLRKYKSSRKIDYGASIKTGEKRYFDNLEDLTVLLKWYRQNEVANFLYKYHWKINMARTLGRAIKSLVDKNPNYVYSILDT